MTQFLRDQASDSEEVVTPLMLDGTYLSRNFQCLYQSFFILVFYSWKTTVVETMRNSPLQGIYYLES